jgi:acetoin utilization deacetylase AcuC-like enzyme
MVIDTDVHHGNGTAAIFATDPSVFTLSIHQQNNYPAVKPPSDLDLPLADGVGDEEYLATLQPAVERALASFPPDILFYVAGADPYYDDQLGGLDLSLAGLLARDEAVFAAAMRRRLPVVVTLAGGYARRVEDTVTIHTNTARSAYKTLSSYA